MRVRGIAWIVLAGLSVSAQTPAPADPVTRLGEYVKAYYSKARSIVAEESVVLQPLRADLTAEGFPRRAVYELRVEWKPDASTPNERATAIRQLIRESGPPLYEKGDERCGDPPLVTPDSLAFLLPDNQPEWKFVMGRPQRLEGRQAMTIDYSVRVSHPARVIDRECLYTDLSGQTLGRLWADPSTAEILRIDERLTGEVDIRIPKEWQRRGHPTDVTVERLNSSVRYKHVAFTDPDETLLLPATIETLHVHRADTGSSRLRITHSFTKYRRFVTGSRVLP